MDYDDEKFIFSDNTTLKQIDNFIKEFCSLQNPMIRDEKWMTILSVCLLTLTEFSTELTNSVGIYFCKAIEFGYFSFSQLPLVLFCSS